MQHSQKISHQHRTPSDPDSKFKHVPGQERCSNIVPCECSELRRRHKSIEKCHEILRRLGNRHRWSVFRGAFMAALSE